MLEERRPFDRGSFRAFLEELRRLGGPTYEIMRAYAVAGPKPTSDELRSALGFDAAYPNWSQSVAGRKEHVTLRAWRLGFRSPFLRAYRHGRRNVLPLDPQLHGWLEEWFATA